MAIGASGNVIIFGDVEVDLRTGWLSRQGRRVRLRPQAATVLSVLLERAGEVVSREELQRRLWPGDTVVDFEIDLNTIVARLREALGDSAESPRYIETLPKRGYRFVAETSGGPVVEPFPRRRLRLMVLPISNLSGNPAEEYFSDAMTDELITALCQRAPEDLAVIARTTAMHYKGTEKDIAHIGRELRVDYVVEGVVRGGPDRVAMNVQLIQAADQTHIFAREYEAGPGDLFDVADRAASDIAGRLGLAAGATDQRTTLRAGGGARSRPTEDLKAYNEYLQARYHLPRSTPESYALARQHLKKAIALDPQFALAYDALAEIDWYQGYFGFVPPRQAFADGIVNALRAIELDNGRGETHALLGQFHKTVEYNWTEVRREMALALELDPASPLVRIRYAVSDLMPHGLMDQAIAEIRLALESDPLSLLARTWLGTMLVIAHRWDEALEEGSQLLQLYPQAFWGYFIRGVAYRGRRQFEEAIAAHRKAIEIAGGLAALIGWLGLTLGLGGNADEARLWLDRLHAAASRGYVPPTGFAWIHIGLGETDAAFEWLNRSVEACDQFMMPIKSYEFLDPLRGDPRFLALLRRMNLEP